jgi:hypothetical protein
MPAVSSSVCPQMHSTLTRSPGPRSESRASKRARMGNRRLLVCSHGENARSRTGRQWSQIDNGRVRSSVIDGMLLGANPTLNLTRGSILNRSYVSGKSVSQPKPICAFWRMGGRDRWAVSRRIASDCRSAVPVPTCLFATKRRRDSRALQRTSILG